MRNTGKQRSRPATGIPFAAASPADDRWRWGRVRAAIAAGLAIVAMTSAAAGAQTRMIDDVEVATVAAGFELRVDFNFRMRYVTHTPAGAGAVLHIQLQPLATPGAEDVDLGGRERTSPRRTAGLPLADVAYEGDAPSGPSLTVRFDRRVRYRVRGNPDLRGVVITVAAESGLRPAAGPARGTPATPPKTDSGRRPRPEIDLSNTYVVNLQSSLKPIDAVALPKLRVFSEHRLYTTRFEKGDKVWHRLRLGFFPSKRAARRVADRLAGTYRDAWVTRASEDEMRRSALTAIGVARPPTAAAPKPDRPARAPRRDGAAPEISEARLASLMAEAEKAMTAGDLNRAVQIYTKVLFYPDHEFRPQAQELLGLARERKGQVAHAKAVYEEYLELYPKGEDADRVRQRLAALITSKGAAPEKLRAGVGGGKDAWRKDLYGGFSQFYVRDEVLTEQDAEPVNLSELSSNLDLTARLRNQTYDFKTQFIGGHLLDFRDGGPDNEVRISNLFIDASHRPSNLSTRLGRQSRSTGGVLGRFDGGLLSYQMIPQIRLNGVAGFPVVSTTSENVDRDTYFYGLSLDLGTFFDNWDFNLFAINQMTDGILDRRAAGMEVRFFRSNGSFFGLFDYDLSYNQPNIALFVGNWIFDDRTTVNIVADYRKSPLLTTANALQGQTVDSLSGLLNTFTVEEVRQLAEDRTAESRSLTLGLSRPVHEKLQLSGDVTVSKLSGSEASGGVPETPGTGYEFFYSSQVIGSNMFKPGDIGILGLRFADADTSNTLTLTVNTRYPVNRAWRFNPRFRADYRWTADGNRTTARPSIRTDYYWRKRRARFELEAGAEWRRDRLSGTSTQTSLNYFGTIGYRIDF